MLSWRVTAPTGFSEKEPGLCWVRMHNSSLSLPSYGEKVERDRTGLLIHVAEIRALGNAKGHKRSCALLGACCSFPGIPS